MIECQVRKNILLLNFEDFHKITEENQHIIKSQESQMTKLSFEIADLRKRLAQEENFKVKLGESLKKKKEEVTYLKDELQKYKSTLDEYGNLRNLIIKYFFLLDILSSFTFCTLSILLN